MPTLLIHLPTQGQSHQWKFMQLVSLALHLPFGGDLSEDIHTHHHQALEVFHHQQIMFL